MTSINNILNKCVTVINEGDKWPSFPIWLEEIIYTLLIQRRTGIWHFMCIRLC